MASQLNFEGSSESVMVLPAFDSFSHSDEKTMAEHLRRYLISDKENIQPMHPNIDYTLLHNIKAREQKSHKPLYEVERPKISSKQR